MDVRTGGRLGCTITASKILYDFPIRFFGGLTLAIFPRYLKSSWRKHPLFRTMFFWGNTVSVVFPHPILVCWRPRNNLNHFPHLAIAHRWPSASYLWWHRKNIFSLLEFLQLLCRTWKMMEKFWKSWLLFWEKKQMGMRRFQNTTETRATEMFRPPLWDLPIFHASANVNEKMRLPPISSSQAKCLVDLHSFRLGGIWLGFSRPP